MLMHMRNLFPLSETTMPTSISESLVFLHLPFDLT